MQCSAVILSNMTKSGQKPFIGMVVTKDKLTTTRQQCKNGGPNRTIRGDKQYPTCGQHNNERACLIEECGMDYSTVAVIGDTHIDLKSGVETTQLTLDDSKEVGTMPITKENSRVMQVIEAGVPGVYKPEDHIVPGTGSRQLQTWALDKKNKVVEIVDNHLLALKEIHGDRLVAMSGMAEGFDKVVALRAIALEIRLWCAIPNKGYGAYYWGQKSFTGRDMTAAFDAIVANAEKVIYVMEDIHKLSTKSLYNKDGRHANFLRNDYMVEQGDEFLVWDPSTSGTKDAFKSIKDAKKPFTLLNLEM